MGEWRLSRARLWEEGTRPVSVRSVEGAVNVLEGCCCEDPNRWGC